MNYLVYISGGELQTSRAGVMQVLDVSLIRHS